MKDSPVKTIGNWVLGGLIIFTFIIPVIPGAVISYIDSTTITCADVIIPFESSTTEDDTITSDQSYTKVEGQLGSKQTCTNGKDEVTSEEVTVYPVREEFVTGAYEEPSGPYVEPAQEYYYSGGSTCNDGSHSNSTGRGTCSWHDGVAY